jgi:RNA polymerase sigma factor (sigma-70 family)
MEPNGRKRVEEKYRNNQSSGDGLDRKFKEIYDSLFSTIFRIAYHITGNVQYAEDICHDAFMKYLEKEIPFPDINQVRYWLIRVVKNLAYNVEKKKMRERKVFKKLEKIIEDSIHSDHNDFTKIEDEIALQEALNMLPYNLRLVLILKEFEGLTYKEIGSIIGISEANVKVRVFRGREKLEKIIKEREGNVPR